MVLFIFASCYKLLATTRRSTSYVVTYSCLYICWSRRHHQGKWHCIMLTPPWGMLTLNIMLSAASCLPTAALRGKSVKSSILKAYKEQIFHSHHPHEKCTAAYSLLHWAKWVWHAESCSNRGHGRSTAIKPLATLWGHGYPCCSLEVSALHFDFSKWLRMQHVSEFTSIQSQFSLWSNACLVSRRWSIHSIYSMMNMKHKLWLRALIL